jgi:hypothetical protein
MAQPGDLHTAALELLNASIDALNTIPTFDPTLLGAPDRAFIDFGATAIDCCDQLAVNIGQILDMPLDPGGLASGRKIAARPPHPYLLVSITRCFPVPSDNGTPPPPDEIEEASRQLNADGWTLWNHLYNLWTADQLFTLCDEVFWDALRPLGPSGGCAGWVLGIHISLDGYGEVIST